MGMSPDVKTMHNMVGKHKFPSRPDSKSHLRVHSDSRRQQRNWILQNITAKNFLRNFQPRGFLLQSKAIVVLPKFLQISSVTQKLTNLNHTEYVFKRVNLHFNRLLHFTDTHSGVFSVVWQFRTVVPTKSRATWTLG